MTAATRAGSGGAARAPTRSARLTAARSAAASGPGRGERVPVIALIVAEALSTVGTRVSFVALPWLVLVTTHDPVKMGIVTGASSLPYVLNGFIASPLVDKIGARRMSNISDVASAGLMALVAVSYRGGIPVIAVLVALEGSFRGIGDRAKNTMLKPLLDATNIDTLRLTSAYTGVVQLAMLTGGSVAGFLIAIFNPWGALWVDAASFLVCFAIVTFLVPLPPGAERPKPPPDGTDGIYRSAAVKRGEPYVKQLGASFTFLRHEKLISNMVRMLFVTNLFSQVGTVTFIPLWISANQGSPIALGWIGGAYALGGVAGNALFTTIAPKIPRYKAFVAGYFLGGPLRFLILAFSHNLPLVVAVWAFCGFALSSANPTIGAVMYRQVPGNMLARVGSLASAISFAGIAIGGIVGGESVEHLNFTHAVYLAAGVYFLATLSPVIGHRTWRLIDTATRAAPKVVGRRVSIRLVLDRHRWTATVMGRGTAPILDGHPVDPSAVGLALGLLRPQPLGSTMTAAVEHEHRRLRTRREQLTSDLAAAEARLSRLQGQTPDAGTPSSNGHRAPIGPLAGFAAGPDLIAGS